MTTEHYRRIRTRRQPLGKVRFLCHPSIKPMFQLLGTAGRIYYEQVCPLCERVFGFVVTAKSVLILPKQQLARPYGHEQTMPLARRGVLTSDADPRMLPHEAPRS